MSIMYKYVAVLAMAGLSNMALVASTHGGVNCGNGYVKRVIYADANGNGVDHELFVSLDTTGFSGLDYYAYTDKLVKIAEARYLKVANTENYAWADITSLVSLAQSARLPISFFSDSNTCLESAEEFTVTLCRHPVDCDIQ